MARLPQHIRHHNCDWENPNPTPGANQGGLESAHCPTEGCTQKKTDKDFVSREMDPWPVISAESVRGEERRNGPAGEVSSRVRKCELDEIPEHSSEKKNALPRPIHRFEHRIVILSQDFREHIRNLEYRAIVNLLDRSLIPRQIAQ